MKIIVQKRSKIFVYFLFGIALPCILLGYFAFRGIQNDRALIEKQTVDKYQRLSKMIVEDIRGRIFEVEKSCFKAIQLLPRNPDPKIINNFTKQKKQYSLIEDLFILESSTQIKFPAAQLLFYPGNRLKPNFQFQPTKIAVKLISRAQQYEFREKKFRQAIALYDQVLKKNVAKSAKANVLNAIARIQRKLSRTSDAILTYQKISTEFNATISATGIPLGLAARLELGSLFLTRGDSLNAVQTLSSAYHSLVQGTWQLDQSQYSFFSSRLQKMLDEILSGIPRSSPLISYKNRYEKIKLEEKEKQIFTRRLLIFQQQAGPLLKEDLLADQNLTSRIAFTIQNQEFLVTLLNITSSTVNRTGGILWHGDYLRDSLVFSAISKQFDQADRYWRVVDKDGAVILESEASPTDKLMVQAKFSDNFPPWTVEVYQSNPLLLEYIFSSRRSIYLYIFILIAGILIFGLVLTIRSVAHELELAKLKSDFVSTVSHEFKSPLTSIRQLAEMLHTGRVSSEERRSKYYNVILEQSEKLSMLIENVLDFSRMEDGRKQFDFEMADIEIFLKNIILAFQNRVQQQGVKINLDISKTLPAIPIDRLEFAQVINNLLDNAVKFSDKPATVLVTCFAEDNYVIVSVEDYGIGIQQPEMKKIFERFYRGGNEATRTSTKGSGLGLTLVKQIVDAHHGEIQVESEPGKGSKFTIKLPA